MKSLDQTITDAQALLDEAVTKKDWSAANRAQGFLDGMKAFGTQKGFVTENRMLEDSIERKDYDRAAYWDAWLSGWAQARACKREEG